MYDVGCCDVVLDQQKFANGTLAITTPGFRKRLNLITGEMSMFFRRVRELNLII